MGKYFLIFDEFLRLNLKIYTLNTSVFSGPKIKGNIGDLPDLDFFRLASLCKVSLHWNGPGALRVHTNSVSVCMFEI